ncbi:hypothetical protein Tco_1502736 [Tanacetum coccineum]
MAEQDSPPPTITAMKIPIIKKGEYDIWSMRMRQYICHTDHNLWDIIVDGDLQEEAAPAGEQSSPPAPKTAKQLTAKRNQERVKSILLLAIPDEYLLKFHNVPDAKSLWAAIKSRFGGNDESKKMQRNVLKHQFENFTTAPNESLDKAYDRFQKLISQLEVHAAPVSKEDRYQPKNLAFLSFENTSSTNEVSPASGNFGQIDQDDLEELDLRWQVAMLTVRGTLLGSANQEGTKGKGLMVIMEGGISSSSSDNEVQNCSKQCLESFKTLQKNFNSEREKHNRARLEIQGYELALESLEYRILGHEKNEMAWGEKYEFQNYELKCREVKINNLKMELEKVVKEIDELKVKIKKWEESSKSLDKLLNSQMSAKDKNGLGYGTQLDELTNDRFSKADGYHAVPPPITGNFLTLRADISFASLDEYVIRKKIIESKTTELKTDTSESKTSETVDDEDDVFEVETVSPVKTNETQTVKTQIDKIGQISQKKEYGLRVLTRRGLVNPVRPNGKRAVHTVSTAKPVSIARHACTGRPFAPK